MNHYRDVLKELRQAGVIVWAENGNLRYRSSSGPLPDRLRDGVIRFKPEILAFLERAKRASEPAEAPIPHAEESDHAPLTFGQERLAFLDQLQGPSAAYNIFACLELNGDLNLYALQRAFDYLPRRHAVMRARIVRDDGGAHQRIAPESSFDISHVSLVDVTGEARDEAVETILTDEAGVSFDLEAGELFRVKLIELDDWRHLLLITMHHIISDGWSMGVLVQELSAAYRAFDAGEEPELPALPIQYTDYAHWERQQLTPSRLAEEAAFWRKELEGAPTLLELPWDASRPAVQTYAGASLPFALPGKFTDHVKDLAKAQGASDYMVLLAAYQAWLASLAGVEDVVVGTPVANRRRKVVEPLIGLFMNTLAIRCEPHGDQSFTAILDQVKERVLAADSHGGLPFDRVVEAVQPERSLSHAPIFQVMFLFQNTPAVRPDMGEVDVQTLERSTRTAKFDLTLTLAEEAGCFQGSFEYNTDLFRPETVARFVGRFTTWLRQALAAPEQPIADINPLPADEREILLKIWNDTTAPLPDGETVHGVIATQIAAAPDATALTFGHHHLTYRALGSRAAHWCHALRGQGIAAGSRVGIAVSRSHEMVAALLGILQSGAAFVPLDPDYPPARLRFMMADAAVDLVIHDPDRVPEDLPEGVRTLCKPACSHSGEPDRMDNTQIVYLLYTSGSTGQPKGVMVSHRNVINFFEGMDRALDQAAHHLDRSRSWLAVTSISFDIAILELFWTLARGEHVVIQPQMPKHHAGDRPNQDANLAFSLFYFASDEDTQTDKYALLKAGAQFAEDHDFQALWVPERHFHAFGGQFPNPSVAAAAVAATTRRLQIRAGSVVAPLHHPARIAEEWSMVDNLSGGRVGLSFASGWHPNDFIFSPPETYPNRHQVMWDAIADVLALWRGESLSAENGLGKTIEIAIRPRPVQATLPVWITAASNPETFQSAGKAGYNLLTHLLGHDINDLAEKIALYRKARAENGFDPAAGQVTLMLHTFVGASEDEVQRHVEKPFKDYLRSSINLMRPLAENLGLDLDQDQERLVDAGFQRYSKAAALMGTPEDCLALTRDLKVIGVNEVACLIDFGIPAETVIEGLSHLDRLRRMVAAETDAACPRDGERYRSPAANILRHGITDLQSTPSLLRMLMDDPDGETAVGRLTRILSGGEALSAKLADQLRDLSDAALFNMYGPTETTVWSTVKAFSEEAKDVTIGTPVANTTCMVTNDRGRPTPIGVQGDLLIGGEGVTMGYWNQPSLTAERFVPDPTSEWPGARVYRTGDRARYRHDGELLFLDRDDRQIKLRGHRIETGEIEAVLNGIVGIRGAVVRLAERRGGQATLAAYLETGARVEGSTVRIVDALRPMDPPPSCQRYTLPNGLTLFHNDPRQLTGLFEEVFRDNHYLRYGIDIPTDGVILDVGANIGSFSMLAHHRQSGVKIHAFEPIPQTFAVLEANMRLHGIDAKAHNLGLSDREETATFTYFPHMSGLSSRFADSDHNLAAAKAMVAQHTGTQDTAVKEADVDAALRESFKAEEVSCRLTTLSTFIREQGLDQIDLLKVDVERSEHLVLRGIDDEDWPRIRQMALEVDGEENLAAIRDLLMDKGFQVAVEDLVRIDEAETTSDFNVFMVYAHSPASKARATVDTTITPQAVQRHLANHLPEYMRPADLVFLYRFPTTPNGKIDVARLPAVTAGGTRDRDRTPPRNEREERIAAIWCEVLDLDGLGVNDNFFELGGNSLLLTRVVAKLQRAFDRDVPMMALFRYPTVAALATFFDDDQAPAETKNSLLATKSRAAERRNRLKRRQRATTQS